MVWKRRALKWGGMSCLFLVLFMLVCVGGFLWAAAEFTRYRPLDLTDRIPQVQKYLLPEGLGLQAEKVELFFDGGPVVRVSGLGVTGSDGTLGVYVEHAAIRLAASQLFLLSAAPQTVEASGVTFRVVRDDSGISIAGLTLPKSKSSEGVVDWLNGLSWSPTWARLSAVRVANLNLLVRDDVQRTEWFLERGNMSVYRYPKDGENGTLTAVIRRISGDTERLRKLDNVPVLVSFAHGPKADGLVIRGRLDRANAQMVMDYFPPQFKDLLQAQGQVEVGTRLLEGNQLEQPWVTLRLTKVKVQPPKGFSEALEFPKLTLTASYSPPEDGVSGTDVLLIKELEAVTVRGNAFSVSGTVTDVQTDPLIDLSLSSPKGELQGVFDLFPDQEHGFAKALHWLRPNIEKGNYENLTAHYAGKPSAFPGCGEQCGTLDIDADVMNGQVRFLKEMSPVTVPKGTFQWRGQTMTVTAAKGNIAGQSATDVKVQMSNIFAHEPTDLTVKGAITGDLQELLGEFAKLPETHGKVPQEITGRHSSVMDINVPMPRGAEPTFASSTVMVSSSIADVTVKGLPELKGAVFTAPTADVNFYADKTLQVVGKGSFSGSPLTVDWSMNLQPKAPSSMKLIAQGQVGGDWLTRQAPAGLVSATGPVGIGLSLQEDAKGKWNFDVKADGAAATVVVDKANLTKAKGDPLAIAAKGSYVPSGTLVLSALDVKGNKLAASGSVSWNPADIGKSTVKLPGLKLGDTDVSVDFANNRAVVTGNRLDLRGYDLLKSDGVSDTKPKEPANLTVVANVNEVLMEGGKLDRLATTLKATNGRWDVQKLSTFVDGTSAVNITSTPLRGAPGRKKLVLDIQDLGRTLVVLGVYDKLDHGKLTGEITYDTPDTGTGLVKITNFELKNPPVLVQLLSLLSLEQLLAGTSSTLFKTGEVPLQVDHGVWYLNNASFDGPSMSLRLDGNYDRPNNVLNFDGKMAPAIPLNRLVARIPLLGTVLTGSQDGVVVADFKLKGTTDSPQINVRPLSVITPGLLKDFWRGVTGGSSNNKPAGSK